MSTSRAAQTAATLAIAGIFAGCATVADVRRSPPVYEHISNQAPTAALTCVARAFDEMSAYKVAARDSELVIHYDTLPAYIVVAISDSRGSRLVVQANTEVISAETAAARISRWMAHC